MNVKKGMPMLRHVALALLLVVGSAFAQEAPLTADAARATPAGTAFTAPAGWRVTQGASHVTLDAPEGDARITIVDVSATNADEAVMMGWKAAGVADVRPVRVALPQAKREGWDERRVFQYETSPNERRTVVGFAWRAGSAWTAIVLDASDATQEKRSAQVSLVLNSLRPAGYQRESFAGRKANALTPDRIQVLKDFVSGGMRDLNVPGAAIAFVEGGRIVWEGGLGVKELGKPGLVDADTLFIAASNTKAMTTMLLAALVDEKKLRWDEPVVEADPAFRLGDAATTRQVEVRHLVCACTGMPRQDLEWLFEFRKATPASALAMLGSMQPTSKFGEVFQYSNLMAGAAGYLGARVIAPKRELGAAYDEAMRTRIFAPAGMRNTTFDFAKATRGNYAKPHGDDVDGKPMVARMDLNYSIVPLRPAGGVWTSAHDFIRYVQLELGQGMLPDGRRLVSAQNVAARLAPQVLVSEDIHYGMGLFVDRRWGVTVIHHGGDLAGYHSDMMWLPEYGVGAVILTNGDSGFALRGPMLRRLVELMFDGKPEAAEQLAVAATQIKEARAKQRERLVVPADAAEAGKLATRYANTALGNLAVRRNDATTVFDVGEWRSRVATRRNDDGTISFITIDPTLTGFEFVAGMRDGRRTLTLRDSQHEYVFAETAAAGSL